jgi:hypothetical protein
VRPAQAPANPQRSGATPPASPGRAGQLPYEYRIDGLPGGTVQYVGSDRPLSKADLACWKAFYESPAGSAPAPSSPPCPH